MSKQLQHSPGPWTTDYLGRLIFDSQNAVICEIWDDQKRLENSRLIAAAPTMLRLLRVIASGMPELRWLSEGELRAAFEETVDLVSRLDGAE